MTGMSPPLTPEQLAEDYDVSQKSRSWSGGGLLGQFAIVGDIVGAVQMMLNFIDWTVFALPATARNLGAPDIIVTALYGIWSFVLCISFWEFISGRRMTRG